MAMDDFPIWRRPRHYMDVPDSHDHVHWVELFFDLIHVVTIFVLGNYLSHHLDWSGFLVFTGLYLAIFYAWADNSVYNSLYISTDMAHRATMAVQIVTMVIIAAAIPEVTGKGWVYFALGYALNRALTAHMYWRARAVSGEACPMAREQGRNFFLLAALFAVSAFLPKPLAFWVFGAGVVMIQLQYMLPRVGTLRYARFVPRLGHISERFGLLMLIMLGEGFFKLVVTLADKGIYKVEAGTLVNVVMGGLSLFALAWIYFDSAGNAKPKSRDNGVLVAYWLAHIAILWSAVVVGVALAGEVYVGFWEPYPTGYGALGTVGLAVFLASLWILQHLVADRDRTCHYHSGGVLLFGIALALLVLVIHPFVPAIVGNALWGLALFSQIGVPVYRGLRDLRRGPISDAVP